MWPPKHGNIALRIRDDSSVAGTATAKSYEKAGSVCRAGRLCRSGGEQRWAQRSAPGARRSRDHVPQAGGTLPGRSGKLAETAGEVEGEEEGKVGV